MNNAEFQLRGVGDPRLAVHATSALPAWLWSTDGTRVLWANPVGARLFGAANGAEPRQKEFGPADPHRRQVAQLAGRLPPSGAIRLERLRGFGAPLGSAHDLRLRAARFCRRQPRHPDRGRRTGRPRDAAARAAAAPGRRRRYADRRLCARWHVRRRQRRRAHRCSVFAICPKPASKKRAAMRWRRAASRRRSASAKWCCSASAAAPMSASSP